MNSIKLKIKNELISLSDVKYKNFHSRLCPGINNILGVRVPVLRKYAKSLLKEYSFYELYKNIDSEYYEEVMLKGMLICLYVKDLEEIKSYILDYVKLIDNWSVCDTFCAGLKITKKYKSEIRDLILNYNNSNNPFELRFMIVMILDYYTEDKYLKDNFRIFNSVKSNDYYVEMAIAWALSVCLIKYYEETQSYLKNCNLSDFIYNKTISKACDSYRVSADKKDELRKMKKFICT